MGVAHQNVSGMIQLETINKILMTFEFMNFFSSFDKLGKYNSKSICTKIENIDTFVWQSNKE